MGLMQQAYDTYCAMAPQYAGIYGKAKEPLVPVSHQIVNAELELTLDADGHLLDARSVEAEQAATIIPVTESSSGRTGKAPGAHPLCDQIQFLSPLYPAKYESYLTQLHRWELSPYSLPKLSAIARYVERGTIVEDLAQRGVISLDEKGLPAKEKQMVRWRVETGAENETPACWQDQSLFQAFIDYYASTKSEKPAFCMVTGKNAPPASQHPKKIINLCANAKLISANDTSGFTYRGRFTDDSQAATMSYEASQKILVYDLGGGTFDVSIIEIEDGTFTVLATGGDTHLGGDDFDQRIVEYAVAEFKKSDRIDLSRDPAAMGRLKEEAEKAKKELSAAPSAQLNLPFIAVGKDGPHHLDISLSRPQFEMMTGDLLARTVAPVQNALRDAGISASQLGKVLLVGGSTRMPAVERQVKELLGCEPSHSLNPDECVAMGAAVQGGLLQGGGKLAGATGAAAQGLVLMDVTPLTLSIETLGGVATPLITRNSMIPTRKSQIFTTARPMQTSVEINVLQGERHFARDNKSLGKFKLTGIRASFSSKPQIEVTFDIDVNGVVKVSAKDLGTGREQNITITGSTNLSENEIQRAMADAAAYEAEDSRRKERLDLHNQAEVLAYKVDEALSKCKKELDKDEKNRIKTDLANLRRCLRKDKPEKMNENEEAALRQAKTQLEESANHLMVLYTSEQGTDGTNNAL